jgi:pimeloyl-ACP methyl ester carboxylesterase
MLREGSGDPLVLLHGVTAAEGVWGDVIPLLAPRYDFDDPQLVADTIREACR